MSDKLARFSILLRDKKVLMFCIFMTLLFQIISTALTVKLDQKHQIIDKQPWYVMLLLFLLSLGLIFIMIAAPFPFYVKQILFILFSIIQGLFLSQVVHAINDPHIINAAALATIANFVVMLILGFIIVFMGIDLGWMGIYLLIALMVLLTISIITMFSKPSKKMNKAISVIIVLVFSLYILYDTNKILFKYDKSSTSCIRGALNYYLDILNLFTAYLSLESN